MQLLTSRIYYNTVTHDNHDNESTSLRLAMQTSVILGLDRNCTAAVDLLMHDYASAAHAAACAQIERLTLGRSAETYTTDATSDRIYSMAHSSRQLGIRFQVSY